MIKFVFPHDVVIAQDERMRFSIIPAKGDPGPGVAVGGTAGQVLKKASGTDYDTEWADPEVTKEEFAALEEYVRGMSPVKTVGPAAVVSVSDAAPLSAEQVVVDIEPVQSGSGDPSPTNVRPITGWAGVNVTRTGKNLLEVTEQSATIRGVTFTVNSDGSITANGTATADTYFPVTRNVAIPAGNYVLSGCPSGGSQSTYSLSSQINNTWQGSDYGGGKNVALTAGGNGLQNSRIEIVVSNGTTVSNLVFRPMLRPAAITDATYEPYQGETYDIAFPASAGTVYGGTLTIDADGTGELVMDRAMIDVTASDVRKWRNDLPVFVIVCAPKASYNAGSKTDKIANCLPTVSNVLLYNDNAYGICEQNAGDIGIAVDGVTTLEEMADFVVNNNLRVVYKLATPVTYTLTAEQIVMLRGTNNVWADTGDTTLAYRADIPAYIDQRINSTRSMIAGIEADMKATKAYSAGDLLIVGDTLYKATTSIASGATFTPGTNVTTTTVAEQLILLANA